MSTSRPTVLIADDYRGMDAAIGRLLAPWCELVGTARDAAALFRAVKDQRPDVVLLDLSLSGGDGFDVCRRLRESAPQTHVIIFTARDDADLRRRAREAGAAGFVAKMEAAAHLWTAVRDAVDGGPAT